MATEGKCRGMEVQLGEFHTEVHAYVGIRELGYDSGIGLVTEVW